MATFGAALDVTRDSLAVFQHTMLVIMRPFCDVDVLCDQWNVEVHDLAETYICGL